MPGINRGVMLGGELNGFSRMNDECRKVKAKGRAARSGAGVVTGARLRAGEGQRSCGTEKNQTKDVVWDSKFRRKSKSMKFGGFSDI